MKFVDLPIGTKKALTFYVAIDGSSVEFEDLAEVSISADGTPNWEVLLPRAEQVFDDDYLLEYMSLEALKAYVMTHSPDLVEEHGTFEQYHQWYIQGETPSHDTCDWPVIACPSSGEALLDGWHRLHSYVRTGFPVIPVLMW